MIDERLFATLKMSTAMALLGGFFIAVAPSPALARPNPPGHEVVPTPVGTPVGTPDNDAQISSTEPQKKHQEGVVDYIYPDGADLEDRLDLLQLIIEGTSKIHFEGNIMVLKPVLCSVFRPDTRQFYECMGIGSDWHNGRGQKT